MRRRAETRPVRQPPTLPLLFCVFLAVAGLGLAVRAHTLPESTDQVERWYAYQSSIRFDFTAYVQPGEFYPSPLQLPQTLPGLRLPVEPPRYRRVLISPLTDRVNLTIRYRFQGDRPATGRGSFRVEGLLGIPNLWQRSYPLLPPQPLALTGTEVTGEATFALAIPEFLAEIHRVTEALRITAEPLELTIRPVLTLQVEGLREPVEWTQDATFRLTVRQLSVEVDDAGTARTEQAFTRTHSLPVTVNLWGETIPVASLRPLSLVWLATALSLCGLLVRQRRLRAGQQLLLRRLAPSMIPVRHFELPMGTAVAELAGLQALVEIQAQTERPVLVAGSTCFLLDGTTCYRVELG